MTWRRTAVLGLPVLVAATCVLALFALALLGGDCKGNLPAGSFECNSLGEVMWFVFGAGIFLVGASVVFWAATLVGPAVRRGNPRQGAGRWVACVALLVAAAALAFVGAMTAEPYDASSSDERQGGAAVIAAGFTAAFAGLSVDRPGWTFVACGLASAVLGLLAYLLLG